MSTQTIIFNQDKGGHFLDWSICFVSDQKEYYNCNKQQYLPVVNSPLTQINSHQHKPNFFNNPTDLEKFYTENKDISKSVIFHQQRNNDLSYDKLGYQTTLSIDLAVKYSDKIIVLDNHKDFVLYDFSSKQRSNILSFAGDKKIISFDESFEDLVNTFFLKNTKSWICDNIWDKREFIALNFKPFENSFISDYHNMDFDHYFLDTKELWIDFEIENLLEYLDLPCNCKKLFKWKDVYKKWLLLHKQKIKFCSEFDTIIFNILNNKDMDLTFLDLDIMQEAAIQHVLIYQYNLNLKSWQLVRFENTKVLHHLLEENFHVLS